MTVKEIGTKRISDAVSGEKSTVSIKVIDYEISLSLSQETKGEVEILLKKEDIMQLIKWLEKASLIAKYGV